MYVKQPSFLLLFSSTYSDGRKRISIGIQPSSVNSGCLLSAQQSAAPDLMGWDVCLSRWELGSFELDLFWWWCNPPDCHPMPGPDWISRHGWGTVCVYVRACVYLFVRVCMCVHACMHVWCVCLLLCACESLYDLQRENFDPYFFPCCFFLFFFRGFWCLTVFFSFLCFPKR